MGGSKAGPGVVARIAACVALALPAGAASFVVDVTTDSVDALPGDGICADSVGACALRAAVQEANALPGPDTITLGAGTFVLSIAGAGEEVAATGDLDVTDALTFQGAGRSDTSIDAQLLRDPFTGEGDRVLDVHAASAVTLRQLTLTGGVPSADGGGLRVVGASLDAEDIVLLRNHAGSEAPRDGGGGIFASDASVILRGVQILENACTSLLGAGGINGRGGGICAVRSDVTLIGGLLDENRAGNGGGIFLDSGTLDLRDATLRGNHAEDGGGGGMAILATLPAPPPLVSIHRSSFIHNAAQEGGGIALAQGHLTLRNASLARNYATTGGGLLAGTGCVVDLFNVTIAGNESGLGGGVHAVPGAIVSVANSIIGDNEQEYPGAPAPDWSGELLSLGYVLVENTDGTVLLGDPTGLVIGQDPGLEAPADNGGATETVGLRVISPAIDAGSPQAPGGGAPACEATDQRLVARPFGAACDLGAYEYDCFDPIDSDGDGGGDACDVCPTVPDPDQRDFDEDGVGDACDCDLDDDGINSDIPGLSVPCVPNGPDGTYDNCPWSQNVDQRDGDADGVGDHCDDCYLVPDPAQADTDGDERGDACDDCPLVSNPDHYDRDGDHVGDACDTCPDVPDPVAADDDGDGMGDACDDCTDPDGDGFGNPGLPATTCATDNCPTVANPGQEDIDDDLHGDACDNCPLARIFFQQDADLDGLGDACDPCTDTDGDGFGDLGFAARRCPLDNCADVANPLQEDVDGDGIGNACDDCVEPSALDLDPSAAPLRVTKASGVSFLHLEWQGTSSHGYDVFRGTIPATQTMAARAVPYDHDASWACNVADPEIVTPEVPGNTYFLLATHCPGEVVSLGRDSLGREIPPGPNPCP